MADRLRQDLIGPMAPNEALGDRPSQRYATGILYPKDTNVAPEEDEDGDGLVVNQAEDGPSGPDSGVALHTTLKPSVMGMSFAIRPASDATAATVSFTIECGTYVPSVSSKSSDSSQGNRQDAASQIWLRHAHRLEATVPLSPGERRIHFDDQGLPGLELYILTRKYRGLQTVTAAVSNLRQRGDTGEYDEQQHFFQVELKASIAGHGVFAPRPSRRAETDDDSRIAALIYRDVHEYVVGHTCSARSERDNRGEVTQLGTEWMPSAIVHRVDDQGDAIFHALRTDVSCSPLRATWLAEASGEELTAGLSELVTAYREWIAREEARIPDLPERLRGQAGLHMDRCRQGADRMDEGIEQVAADADVRLAFQLAQEAMAVQFSWARDGDDLVWRPFQLAFQLLSLASTASREHPDRATMDLLWFPTGGGKTEAYLALTAFVIFLRRLRRTEANDGAGVAVLMRYTLRLLTIQQFQRAAALICACELLRRSTDPKDPRRPDLGEARVGIGLWVGGPATPLTLKDAAEKATDDYSTPKQLTLCPCCGETLQWAITRHETTVTCPSEPEICDIARHLRTLPVWTIDEEVYQHAPSLVIGTVDKFAQVVRKLDTRALFGANVDRTPPDLIIQDELHLISGPLGSMAGLYETAIDELCRTERGRAKIVGSTATIRRAETQIRALFDRDTYQFPSPGIDASNSGFAVTDKSQPARRYLGLTTAGRSATYTLQALSASLLQAATEEGATDAERFHYWTLLVYFNSLRELGRALVLMQDDVPFTVDQLAARHGEEAREIDAPAELTSRVRSYEIRDMLERLAKGPPDPEAVDLLLASNMISVGMDIPRLGLMVVNSQPKSLSEYIQATSRVGRGEAPGLIVTMYNNMRARDRSHYESFETWHQSLYRDVEATSVTPFASRAQDKALHAVLVALARHKVPRLANTPVLTHTDRGAVEEIAAVIERRAASADPDESPPVARKLRALIDEWADRTDLKRYWDDYGKNPTLLVSAEQFAARTQDDDDTEAEGARRALWAAPNSMREVEPGTPFVLRRRLRTEDA